MATPGGQNTDRIEVTNGNIGRCTLTAANTNLDGTGTLITCFTAGANGSRLHRIVIVPIGANVATLLRLFTSDGANARLWKEIELPVTQASNTAKQSSEEILVEENFPTGWSVQACLATAVSSGWQLTSFGGNY